jgi:hypothetical protein
MAQERVLACRPRERTSSPRRRRSADMARGTSGYPDAMEVDVLIQSVEEVETRSGKIRYVVRDADGKEYTTFRPAIGREAAKFEGRYAHIAFHEEERNGFQNVYLDAISEAIERPQSASDNTDPDEVAWNTAVEAAPWMLGSREPQEEIPPEELYEKLEPFKRLVADDIRQGTPPADD